ncbi:helix-turn-helix domain-containing protein [Microbacterium sp. NPDC096154]|uniref:PucR family transcriptional regulator n=1 Tax=Microbacterium sp. NPDC096154 TaxID=3155549 RepID=UPI00332427CF
MTTRIADLLAHVPDVPRPETLNDDRTIEGLSAGIEPRVVDWALATAHVAVQETYRDIAPSRFAELAHDTARSIEAISLNLMRYLLGGRETAAAVRVSRAQHQVTLDAVRLGIPLHRIVGGLRTLDHVWKTAFIRLVLDTVPRDEAVEVLSRVDRALSTYFDALVDDNARSWAEEDRRLSDQLALGKRQLVEQIIAGTRVEDAQIREVLGVGAGDEHTGLILSTSGVDVGVVFDFAGFRAGLERAYPGHTVTFLPADVDTVWVFLSGSPIPHDALTAHLRAAIASTRGALVSVGLPRAGAEGLRATHLTAAAAHAFNRLATQAGPVVAFAEAGLLALVAQTPQLARWFVEHEVGPLLDPSPLRDELRQTLQTIIGFNGSLVRTAEALYVHRNTITYRLGRIQEILGRDPLERPVETRTALLLAELL